MTSNLLLSLTLSKSLFNKLPDSLTNEALRKLTENSVEHMFSAEVPKMMKLIINSLYSNKEVLRTFANVRRYFYVN